MAKKEERMQLMAVRKTKNFFADNMGQVLISSSNVGEWYFISKKGQDIFLTQTQEENVRTARQVHKRGYIYMDRSYGLPECAAIYQVFEPDCDDNLKRYLIRAATEQQIAEYATSRVAKMDTGWVDKSKLITVRDDELKSIVEEKGLTMENARFFRKCISGKNPYVIFTVDKEVPGPGYAEVTNRVKRRKVFRLPTQFIKENRFRAYMMLKWHMERDRIIFDVPLLVDEVTGSPINPREEDHETLKLQPKYKDRLTDLRGYVSREKGNVPERLKSVTARLDDDKVSLDDSLLENEEVLKLIEKIKKHVS